MYLSENGLSGALNQANSSTIHTIRRQTRLVEKILGIEGGFIVEMENTFKNKLDGTYFFAEFGCSIGEKSYTLFINGEANLLEKTPQYPGRKHPFSEYNRSLKDIIRDDIHPNMNFTLVDKESNRAVPTNTEFWRQFRQRIPVGHPLSLIPTI